MQLAFRSRWGHRDDHWRLPAFGLLAAVMSITAGAAVAYKPILSAGILFLLLVAVARSQEAAVALWLGLRVLMFSGYIALPLGEVMLGLIVVVASARQIISGRRLQAPRSPLLWLVLLLLVSLNVAYFGFVPESRDYAIEIFIENVLLVTLIANTESRWRRDGATTAVAVVLGAVGSVAALEWVTGRPLVLNTARIAYAPLDALHTFEGVNRLGSLLLNPDLLAAAMVVGFVVWIGIALEERGVLRWIAILGAAGMLSVAFLTLSRTVFLGAPVGLGVLFVLSVNKGRVSTGQVAFAIIGACAAVFAAVALVPNAWYRVTTDLTDPLRVGAYETAVRIISAHPLAGLGAGWNRYYALAEQYRIADQYRPLAHPHNSFLELGAMLGLPVLLVVVVLIGKAFSGALSHRVAPGSAIPIAGLAAIIVMSLVGDPITIPVLSNVFWALWAVAGQRSPESRRAQAERRSELSRSNAKHWTGSPT